MRINIALLVFVTGTSLACGTYYLMGAPAEDAAIERLIRQLGDAINKRDLATWERICDPNILVMEQGKENVGWADFRDNHIKAEWDAATDFNLDVGKIQVNSVGKDFAWATDAGTFKGKMKDGAQVQLSVLGSWLFQKKGGAWKLVHAHWSFLPAQN